MAEEMNREAETQTEEIPQMFETQEEAEDNLSDAYFQEIADSLAYAEPPLEEDEYQTLKESADSLHGALEDFEDAERHYGPDQDTWDAYARQHMDIKDKIERAGDKREQKAKDSECKAAVKDAKTAMDGSTDFLRAQRDALQKKARAQQEQIEALQGQIAKLEEQAKQQKQEIPPAQNQQFSEELSRVLAALGTFMEQVERSRKEAETAPRPIASELFKSTREQVKDAWYTVKFAPARFKDYLEQKAWKAADSVLHSVAGTFDSGIRQLENRRQSILSHSHEYQNATEMYHSLADEMKKKDPDAKMDLLADRRIAQKMADAGFGAYTIKETLRKESPNRKEMEEGKAEEFAASAEEETQKRKASEKQAKRKTGSR